MSTRGMERDGLSTAYTVGVGVLGDEWMILAGLVFGIDSRRFVY